MTGISKVLVAVCAAGTLFTGRLNAQCTVPGTQALLRIEDGGGRKDTVFFGHDPSAGIGLDTLLCERELPPVPPSGALDFRFLNPPGREGLNTPAGLGQGVVRDYRDRVSLTQVDTHRVRFQPGTGGLPMTLSWSPAELALLCDSALLVDEFGGFTLRVRMQDTSLVAVTNPALITLLLITYGAREIPAAPALVTPANGATGVTLPVTLTWQVVPGAAQYRLQVSTDSTFGTVLVDESGLTGTGRSLSGLTPLVKLFWRVRASNILGDGPWSVVRKFTPGAVTTFTYGFPSGWSMLSLPVRPADARSTVLFPGAATFASTFSASGYIRRDTLLPGEGYWLKFSSPQSPVVAGTIIAADTIPLAAGWNMTGSITAPVVAAGVQTVPPGILASVFYGYAGSYVAADTLRPGAGYWVKSSAAGQLILHTAPAGAPPGR